MSIENSTNYLIQWLMNEFVEMRKEIERRSKEQFICLTASITSLGITLVFISHNPKVYSPLLIIIPWILTIFGIIWTDHSHHIFLIGDYIRDKIESKIKEITSSEDDIGWQHFKQHVEYISKGMKGKSAFIVRILPVIYFILPSISCIIAYCFMRFLNLAKLPLPIEITLLLIGVILTVCLITSYYRALKVGTWANPEK